MVGHRHTVQRVLGAAATEPAQPVAIRNVQIKRDRRVRRQPGQPARIGPAVNARVEMWSRRIAGVTRDRLRITLDQIMQVG